MRSGHICRLGAIAGRMACVLAAALLACASLAHAQVIEEGGLPVKGGNNSGEPFSLSCPPRLYVEAGESVLFSCSATAVPEEGVRYEWESVSGDGFHLLSASDELSPLFTAPLSGEGAEYVYRLTAMSAGVYETVTVIVGGVSGESVSAPVVREECDPFAVPDGLGEGCAEDKGPAPFGFDPESEGRFLFPEGPGLPDRPSGPVRGGGSGRQAPPRLECPVAVFLEELETGLVECHAWDASGEEHLEYSWEPVRSTTRDYLDNPLLIPEDSPTPSVVAPEVPAYETLESFRSGETTFRYRYRLTATSRATGLSSSSEVEVFVSSSRPGVYCPLEVVVEEGSAAQLDCEGVDPLSFRMDYDENGASILWEWEGLWGTSTEPLAATDRSSPLFTAPAGNAGEEYHYIASMTSSASGLPRTARRRVTVSVTGAEDASGRMNNPSLTFPGNPFTVTEWQRNVKFEYHKSDTIDSGGQQTPYALGLESIDSAPDGMLKHVSYGLGGGDAITFRGPSTIWNNISDQAPCVDADTTWGYKVCLIDGRSGFHNVSSCSEVALSEQAIADLSITILDSNNPACFPRREAIGISCAAPDPVHEGAPDFALSCRVTSEPSDARYSWSSLGNASDTELLSATDILSPVFYVPDAVDSDTDYSYRVHLLGNSVTRSADVTVTVKDKPAITVTCADSPYEVDEGDSDITLRCDASGGAAGSTYTWSWSPTARLTDHDTATPVFAVPSAVDSDTNYEYTVTATAGNAGTGVANVLVRVRDTDLPVPVVSCNDSDVYEGSVDFDLRCTVRNEPSGASYRWSGTDADNRLSSTTELRPTFLVPEDVDSDTDYEYRVTLSGSGVASVEAAVTVTVLNKGALAVACAASGSVYEGSEDIAFDCEASGAPAGSAYEYVWTPRGDTPDTALLSAANIASPVFFVPEEVDEDETYAYLLTVSAENAESGSAEVTVTVLNAGVLRVVCALPASVYEDSEDIAFDCEASGAPGDNPEYTYVWTARGDTPDVSLLSAADVASPVFYVPDEVDENETYAYLLTVSAENAEDGAAEVMVTVLNKEALSVVCTDPGSVYEGSEDIAFDCEASGAPGDNPEYAYAWAARGSTPDASLLSALDISSPMFYVPDEVSEDEAYEYLLTVSADNAESATAEVSVTVLNKEALSVVCTDPGSVYEGSEDIAFDCSASGAPGDNPEYAYAWAARGSTPDASLLSALDISSPMFYVPDEVSEDEAYEYLLTVSADNAESATAEVTVTVLNKGALAIACADPGSVYEGSEDIAFDCSASGAPGDNPQYTYAWMAWGDTQDTSLLSAADIASPTFYVPDEVDANETYEYLLTVSAANAEDGAAEVTVTVLNKGALAVVCADPRSVYEGSEDIAFDCSASGAPGDNPEYAYVWMARGDTQDTALLSATDIASPTFHVPEEVDEDETYEYLLTARAANAEDATAEVTVTVLDRIQTPDPDPVSPPMASSSSAREPSDPSALGVTVSASPLRFGVQSADMQTSLDPVTDGLSTHVSGPYHAGRMTLSPGGSEEVDENGEMDLSIEIASPVVLRREGGIEAASIVLSPQWSLAESCEQLSSQTIGGLYTEVTLSEDACRLLRFGGDLDLTGVPSGYYAGSMDIVLRSGESEETYSVEVDVTVIPAQRVITIGPGGGVRFSTSRELPVGLTEEQNLSIYPDVAFLTEEKPHGVFELSNPSLIPLEISVSARFGYTEATENGREVVVEDASGSHLGDLSQVVDIHPGVLVLMPGEKGLVRYGMQEGALAAMAEKGYAAFFDVVSSPRQYVRSDRMPEEVSGDRTARVTMRVPGVYVPGEGASQLRAALLSISFVGPMSATFLLETQDHPFAGEVVAYDGDGRELGRRETLVYTRSRVRIPLDRMPEEGTVFLRFAPRGSGRAPLPTSVEWDAPRRDIGEAEKKEKTPMTATAAGRP